MQIQIFFYLWFNKFANLCFYNVRVLKKHESAQIQYFAYSLYSLDTPAIQRYLANLQFFFKTIIYISIK